MTKYMPLHFHPPSCWILDKIHDSVLNQERESCMETLNDFASWMEAGTKEACSALSQAANDMAHFYDAHHKEAPLYKVGDKVWLNGQNITITHPMKKLDHKWIGLYVV